MTASDNTELPLDVELDVPQELTLSTPWLKAVVVYMGTRCEKEMNVSFFKFLLFKYRSSCFYVEKMETILGRF